MDVSSYRHDKRREYCLGVFKIRVKFGDYPSLDWPRSLGQRLRLPGFAFDLGRVRIPGYTYVLKERSFAFDPTVLDSPDNVYLDGFWQSEKYFVGIEEIIRKEFAMEGTNPNVQELARRIRATESVCVNVRRRDYVSIPSTAAFLGFVGTAYYAEGMKLIQARVRCPSLFVFSDEIEWCIANLRFENSTTYVGHEYAGEKFQNYLYLMSLCKHFIIPNSTFAWWGAWLSNTRGTIVAPKGWFCAPEMDASDIVPNGWFRL
jgi:hypothetical protein